MEKNKEFILDATEVPNRNPEYLETLFALGNGKFGIRAGNPLKVNHYYDGNPGLFVNGFFETEEIQYGEWAHGYAKKHQTICKLPNLRGVILRIGMENSAKEEWQIELIMRQLDMKEGILYENYAVKTPKGKSFELKITSFASIVRHELFVCKYELVKQNFEEPVYLSHTLFQKGKVTNDNDDPRVVSKKQDLLIEQKKDIYRITTKNSQKKLAIKQIINEDIFIGKKDCLVSIFQIGSIKNVSEDSLNSFECDVADYESLIEEQKLAYSKFWAASDIQIKGDDFLQKGIRFNLFHLNQGAGRDGRTNFPAKGLTGEGYEGHYFWDTEMYMLPFFIYTQPESAKKLLTYRWSVLEHAKARAKVLNQEGALFAWRTIDGHETSAYYPAGTAQVHINADIVYGFQLYEHVTGDQTFIKQKGCDVVFETAKFWLSFGDFLKKDGEQVFCINGVTGPDEYSALVNNNYYTNKMAQNNLRYAVELSKRFGLFEAERKKWKKAADLMYLGYNQDMEITKQDDGFMDQAFWDFANTPKENYPLLLHYHPMVIYKYQVCKQADTILAEMLFTDDFSKDQLMRDYAYYEQLTTHDSSLSRSIFSVMASRTGQKDKAYNYFMDTALMDLTDLQGNAADGVHAANMGGSWLSLIYGFAGLRYDRGLKLTNHLPEKIKELRFQIFFKRERIEVILTQETIKCILIPDSNYTLTITEKEVLIN
ncbi:glycoside hydrolase family 65 protein [Enterococcus ureasiticus]|uniref:Maltose phosphorylase n=1 Tax=Enterococcus ureasiticus TaxID=903984 RepID=A0A1E5GP88_9ENTE|nr:glycoside hydrolase family 65 protein [Enterococcus ureasiticus]OEG14030.1 maltose phosphorylase [Enterococcus ureasiticus]